MGHILVVDDDIEVTRMLQMALEKAGYEVETAKDGKQAVKLYHSNPADLVILDIIMPEKDGIETIRELRHDVPDIKIIAISAGGRIDPKGYLVVAKRLGAVRAISKPFDLPDMLQAIREVLDSAER